MSWSALSFPSYTCFQSASNCRLKVTSCSIPSNLSLSQCQRTSWATCSQDSCTSCHKWLSTDDARLWTTQRHWLDLTRVAPQELTLLTHHATRSLIRLVFLTVTPRSLLNQDLHRFVVWQVMSSSAMLLIQLLIIVDNTWARPNNNNDVSIAETHKKWHCNMAMTINLFRVRQRECDMGKLN